ncbi:ATP-binding protein [Actinomadura vinacea]|uniref:ATP-binding protein n=1 Tax=Actinomadura vinacea TaxID=115336 RepID=UPI0031E407E5
MGRRQAVGELRLALSRARLVTLTGPAGVGKSRLALRVARRVRRAFPDGAVLIELAGITEPTLVPSAVAAALELIDHSNLDAETVLLNGLANRRMLLVLDNCEHLLNACGHLVDRLLSAAPGLRVLATSREPLGIGAERVWPVPPLSLPTVNRPDGTSSTGPDAAHEAITLFGERAAAVAPSFAVDENNVTDVARLCQRLDGLPLAIELAAGRMRVMSVEQILARLDDRFRLLAARAPLAAARHRTLRAAVEWSFDLCTPSERTLWARCSVFAGEFDLDAAEAVCSDDELPADQVLSSVAGLVDKSVLTRVEHGLRVRYRMLETIREFGQERLAERGEEAILRRRHRDHYLRLAEQTDIDASGPRQAELAGRARADRADIWAALDYCCTTPGEARAGLRLATGFWYYWFACGFVRDGRRWLDRLLALDTAPSSERARALWVNGFIAHLQGNCTTSLRLDEESRELAGQLGDETALTYATQCFAGVLLWSGELDAALPLLDQVLARHRASGDWTAFALLIFALCADAASRQGRMDEAMELVAEARSLGASLGDRWMLSCIGWGVGVMWWMAGVPAKAREPLIEALREKADLDDQLGIMYCLEMLSLVAGTEGDWKRAAVLYGAAARMREPIDHPLFGAQRFLDWSRQCETDCRKALGDAAFTAISQQGAQLAQPELITDALGADAFAPPSAGAPSAQASAGTLTRREVEVAALIAGGMSNKQIAAELVIAQRTAEAHVEHILSKLGFTCRAQIATWVTEQDRPPGKGEAG